MKRVLVLFPDEWDHAAARDPRYGDCRFLFEGFDLFRFPDNARLFTFDALAFIERVVRRYRDEPVDAVVTSDEQFGPFIASLVAQRLGLPHAPIASVLTVQHKHYARRAFERLAPEANVRFGLLRRGFSREEVPLPYPFYVKPAKAAFSVLARRVDSFDELRRHLRFGWFERAVIAKLVKPFADVMRAHSDLVEDPLSMVAEQIAAGRQVTANGFARAGRVTMLGTVDSIMYPGTDHFMRFQYPSGLDAKTLARIDALAIRLVEGLGFANGMFNIEMRVDPGDGRIRVIEMNPRAAGQFYDLFERVDGFSPFDAMIALACGDEPRLSRGQGRQRHAASFVLRDLAGEGLSRWPGAAQIERLRALDPDAHVMIYPKRGADLARELKWLGSYRYGVVNLGGATLEEMFERFAAISARIDFHPASGAAGAQALAAETGDD